MKIRTVGWRRDQAKCAYCLDTFSELVSLCVGCGVAIHAECREELGCCPTMGCAAGRSQSDRAAHAGRVTRDVPDWRVRIGPYASIYAMPAVFGLSFLVVCGAGFALVVSLLPGLLRAGGPPLCCSLPVIACFWVVVASVSNARTRAARLRAALDDGAVRPYRLLATQVEGRVAMLLQPAGEGVEEVVLSDVDVPVWLTEHYGQQVYLHGAPELGEAGAIEFEDGRLALLED